MEGKESQMKTAAEMRALVRRHVQLWKTTSHAEWRACFAPDYTIEDPVGTGQRPMGSYETEWHNMHASSLRLDMEIYRLTVGGNEIVADLRAVTHLASPGIGADAVDGLRSTLSYTGIYTVNNAGLLCANRTFADPVSDALWKAFYPTLPSPAERDPLPRSEVQLRQAVEDHLYFWNAGTREAWRRRFREDAWIEDPVGSGRRPLGSGREVWDPAHARHQRVSRGCNRVIVCGMETLAHTVSFEEPTGGRARSRADTELFTFDAEGRITSWRVFHGDDGA